MVEFPNNELTQMIEKVAASNRSGVRPGGVASATPLPTVQSAALGREVLPPLSEEERDELDRRAREAGVRDERLGDQPEGTPPKYSSLDEAIAAGAPVNPPPGVERRTAREAVERVAPRIPDFSRVQGIDLETNAVLVDGMEFPISERDATWLKHFAVDHVRKVLLKSLDEAVSQFAAPAEVTGGSSKTAEADADVQRQSEGSGPKPSV